MPEYPHLKDAQHAAMDLLATSGAVDCHKTLIKLLIEILEAVKAHDARITRVEDGFANDDPPGHRKVHEHYTEKANLANEDKREIRNKVSIAVIGAGVLWLIQTLWPLIAKALMTGGVR